MIPVDTPGTPPTWVLPQMPEDDVAAWRQLAGAFRQLAAELRDAGAAVQVATGALPIGWSGLGERASAHPLTVLQHDLETVSRGLDESAGRLDETAAELQRAHEAHAWTWQKIVKVGAVVVISGAAVYVTAGLAAPGVASVDAAVLGTEVAAVEGTVATAAAARTGLTAAVQVSSRLFGAVRGLGAVVRPQLPWATAFTGAEAGREVADTGSLDPVELATTFGIGLTLPGAMAGTRSLVRGVPVLVSRPGAAAVSSHLAAGAVAAGFDTSRQQFVNGRVDAGQVLRAGATGATMSAAGDLLQRLPVGWRPGAAPAAAPPGLAGVPSAGVPRQTLDAALRDGVHLPAHEGELLGHALERHVSKTDIYLSSRLQRGGPVKSSFFDEPTASRAITDTLRAHREDVLAYERGELSRLPSLRLAFDEPIGRVLTRAGERLQGRTCIVVLRRDAAGPFIFTAFVAP